MELIHGICAVFFIIITTIFAFMVTCEVLSWCGYGLISYWITEQDEKCSVTPKDSSPTLTVWVSNNFSKSFHNGACPWYLCSIFHHYHLIFLLWLWTFYSLDQEARKVSSTSTSGKGVSVRLCLNAFRKLVFVYMMSKRFLISKWNVLDLLGNNLIP